MTKNSIRLRFPANHQHAQDKTYISHYIGTQSRHPEYGLSDSFRGSLFPRLIVVVDEMLEPGWIVSHDAGHPQLLGPLKVCLFVKDPQVGGDTSLPEYKVPNFSSYSLQVGTVRSVADPDPPGSVTISPDPDPRFQILSVFAATIKP